MGIETLNPEWLKSHRKGVRAKDAVEMYTSVYANLRAQGIFVVGLFITPAEADERALSAGSGRRRLRLSLHRDLVAQKGSALYDNLTKTGSVGKDMFYHDWNMPSIVLAEGAIQNSHRNTRNAVVDSVNRFAIRSHFSPSRFARRPLAPRRHRLGAAALLVVQGHRTLSGVEEPVAAAGRASGVHRRVGHQRSIHCEAREEARLEEPVVAVDRPLVVEKQPRRAAGAGGPGGIAYREPRQVPEARSDRASHAEPSRGDERHRRSDARSAD